MCLLPIVAMWGRGRKVGGGIEEGVGGGNWGQMHGAHLRMAAALHWRNATFSGKLANAKAMLTCAHFSKLIYTLFDGRLQINCLLYKIM